MLASWTGRPSKIGMLFVLLSGMLIAAFLGRSVRLALEDNPLIATGYWYHKYEVFAVVHFGVLQVRLL